MKKRVGKDERQERLANTLKCWNEFVEKFFVGKKNFLYPGRDEGGRIFSKGAIDRAMNALADAGEGNFNEVARKAFEGADDSVKFLFSHAVFVYELIITSKNKSVALKERDIDCLNLGGFAYGDKLYLDGCSGIGNYLMANKKPAIEYVLRLFEHLAEHPLLASARDFNQAIKSFCEEEYKAPKGGVVNSMSSVILWYVAPDEYEPISAQSEKRDIAKNLAHLIKDDSGYSDDMLTDTFKVNKALRMIRQKLEAERDEKISFYDADVETLWRVEQATPVKQKESPEARPEEGFVDWMYGVKMLTESTVNTHINMLKNKLSGIARDMDLIDGVIFDLVKKAEFAPVRDKLKANLKFANLSTIHSWSCRKALDCYDEYLAYKEAEQANDDSPDGKDTKENGGNAMTGKKQTPLNRIFYGPPGTGKTYGVVEAALRIIDGKNLGGRKGRGEQMERFKKLQKAKRIAMVTFHQNFAYEDFIEGIKPKLTGHSLSYVLENGIFKEMALLARKRDFALKANLKDGPEGILQAIINCRLGRSSRSSQESMTIGEVMLNWSNPIMAEAAKNLHRFYRIKALAQGEFRISAESPGIDEIFKDTKYASSWYEELKNHPSIVGDGKGQKTISRAQEYGGGGTRKYVTIKIDFESMMDAEIDDEEEGANKKPYVLIIDEINRGNVSAIFGELITLLEEDKRLGRENALRLILPYSKKHFGVPDNLHIIGTMNTADRSIALLDTALRRRFHFVEMMPDPQKAANTSDISGVDCGELLEAINEKICFWYDREHQIGHAYLMNLKKIEELKAAFQQKIIPLLQEYFFDDWEKIDLVLNKNGFIQSPSKGINGEEKTLYSKLPFGDEAWDKAENYREIYNKKDLQAGDE